jgi:hypothetical protein
LEDLGASGGEDENVLKQGKAMATGQSSQLAVVSMEEEEE